MKRDIKKAVVVGAGFVGSTTAFTLMLGGTFSEVVLIDINKSKADGEIMDMNHGMPFVKPVRMLSGTWEDCRDADMIIITAGAAQKPGETRLDLVQKNTAIFRTIIGEIKKYNTECILLIVTNPVDILTYVAWKLSGFPKNRVIGSGTVLDTARFRYLLGEHAGVDARNIHAYIMGEHGDSEVMAWSTTNIAGIPMEDYCDQCDGCQGHLSKDRVYEGVRDAAYEIIERKGATYYAVALAVRRICEAVMRDEKSILTVSGILDGQYGFTDIALSVPTIVDRHGIHKTLEVPLSENERQGLENSAKTLHSVLEQLNLD